MVFLSLSTGSASAHFIFHLLDLGIHENQAGFNVLTLLMVLVNWPLILNSDKVFRFFGDFGDFGDKVFHFFFD